MSSNTCLGSISISRNIAASVETISMMSDCEFFFEVITRWIMLAKNVINFMSVRWLVFSFTTSVSVCVMVVVVFERLDGNVCVGCS